jgi:hypothetical protein
MSPKLSITQLPVVYTRHVSARFDRIRHAIARAPLGLVLAWFATLFFAGACLWEAWGIPDCGHYCSTAQVAMGGINMMRWKIFGAVPHLTREVPPISQYYAHHPYGVFASAAVFTKVLGMSPFAMRATGIVHGVLTPVVLYRVLLRLGSRTAAGVATLVFVLVPIDLAFARFGNLEGVAIFWGLVFSCGTLELLHGWRKRYIVVSCLGALGAAHADWIGALFVLTVIALVFVTGFLRGAKQRWDYRTMSYWLLASLLGAGTLVFYVMSLQKNGQLVDLISVYGARSSGSELPIASVFSPRRMLWIHWTLPLYALWLAPLGAAFAAIRWIRRDVRSAIALGWFVMATVQYFLFKQGADIHVFWPHYYGVCIAFGAAEVAELALRLPTRAQPLALLAGLVFALVLGREGLVQLRQSRITSGRFDEGGNFVDSMREHAIAARWAYDRLPREFNVSVHASIPPAPHLSYAAKRPLEISPTGSARPEERTRYTLFDRRAMSIADRASASRGAVAYRWTVRAPNAFEWLTLVGTEPMFVPSDEVDAYATWELLSELGRTTPALTEPSDPRDLRVYSNYLQEAGDADGAARFRTRALEGATPCSLPMAPGITLVGYRAEELGGTYATLYFATDASFTAGTASFSMRSKVIAPPRLWTSAIDHFERDIPPPKMLQCEAWKPNHLYQIAFKIPKRIGLEEYHGTLQLRNVAGPSTMLFRL